MDVIDRTGKEKYKLYAKVTSVCTHYIQNFRVATSEAVVNKGGPAFGQGIFAMASLPSSMVRSKALLKFPSSLTT